ncbi:hypothetical protein [Niveibacterium sp.]|uniref:hypothetical protein n=1 Tax=Niveibacterium sp. TaxID=2017444 RepID=UPI0035B1A37E
MLWSDTPNDKEASRRSAGESAKRFLAALIAVGTVDQALLGTLQVKYAHLRHALVARSVRAAAAIAVQSLAEIPQQGFIHEDCGQSFILDFADLYRDA